MVRLVRHRTTKDAATDRLRLRNPESCFLLYPALLWPQRIKLCLTLFNRCFPSVTPIESKSGSCPTAFAIARVANPYRDHPPF
jgi:hypothetical protein